VTAFRAVGGGLIIRGADIINFYGGLKTPFEE
jgi:hypothetical protein